MQAESLPDFGMVPFEAQTAKVVLPTFHPAQAKLRWVMQQARFVVARCGRRWGKNVVGESVAIDDAAKGRLVGWFAPENKRLSESYNVIVEALGPIKKSSDKTHGIIKTITGGSVEFWSLEDQHAGRSRKYHRVIGDEIAFTKPKTIDVWTRSIKPTLLDYSGRALMMSNTNGLDPENMLYDLCHNADHGFVQFHAPTRTNPFLPQSEIEALERNNHPLVYKQEYLADFVDFSGDAFFARDKFLVNGEPMDMPLRCEAVYGVIDSATKTGKTNDGTAVVIVALIRNHVRPVSADGRTIGPAYRLVILDWDLVQIEGALLETWLPTVFQNLDALAAKCGSNRGSLGVFIEDASSGMILLQQARRRGWPAFPIDSPLTKFGKDERCISVSGYVYTGLVKIARPAYEKTTNFKGTTRNHLMGQLTGFRVGDKDATRQDDLLDAAVYSAAIALGNAEGF